MITWNYRVFREDDGDHIIREVFYDEHDAIVACTADAVEPLGRTFAELVDDVRAFQAALDLPVLTLDDVPVGSPVARPSDRRKNQTLDALLQTLAYEIHE